MKPKLLLGLALVLSGGWFGCSTHLSSPSQKPAYQLSAIEVQQIDQALPRLKAGMTGEQVGAILDQTPFKGITFRSASGPMRDYRFFHYLRPGYNLILVYDQTAEPPRFVRYMKAGDNWNKP